MTLNWIHQKRRHKRYDVLWKALLEIDSPDFNDFMLVPIVNISRSGALIHSSQIYMHNYHIAEAARNDELNLIIHSPKSELDSKVMVKRYDWNEKIQGFHIGVEFKDICSKNQEFIDDIVKRIPQFDAKDLKECSGAHSLQ
ncbi:MAG: PilZ domain-containing protein [Proteobacteria bacterium]|nr:PilZ domain-containing protein [Pseudomonadota bacterium]